MEDKPVRNYRPEIVSLIHRLEKHGCTVISGDNGDDVEFTIESMGGFSQFVEELEGCDEAWLTVKTPNGKHRTIYLVYGNEPGVIAADYQMDPAIDAATEEHYEKWQNAKQPMMMSSKKYPELHED